MRTLLALFALALPLLAQGADFTRTAEFDSVESFVSAGKAFQPSKARNDLAELFTMPELGQPDDPKTGSPVTPKKLSSCESLWIGGSQALVFATARPETDATQSAVGVLFLLSRTGNRWAIADLLRFTATGHYASVGAELTAGGFNLGNEYSPPIITVQEGQGGRGYGYRLSGSFSVDANRLKPKQLE